MHRRDFCRSLATLPGTMSLVLAARASEAVRHSELPARRPDASGRIAFVLEDPLEHPFYHWPRTLLGYPVECDGPLDSGHWQLIRTDTGEMVPFQVSLRASDNSGQTRAVLHFFSDLPSGGRREFVLSRTETPKRAPMGIRERREGTTVVVDTGALRVRIPSSQTVHGVAPGPILQISRGGTWFGRSTLEVAGDPIRRITCRRTESGPLFITYELQYETARGAHYRARVQCEAGMEFVRLQEDMEELPVGIHGVFQSDWSDLHLTHRQAPNHPFPLSDVVRDYDDYVWERIGDPWKYQKDPLPPGQLPFWLGVYERAPGNFRSGTFANFWNQRSNDALGVFIDDVSGWQTHEYACEVESPALQVRYVAEGNRFVWQWPLVRGRRSTCVAFYDHALDRAAQRNLERRFRGETHDGTTYSVPLTFTSHTLVLQNRHGSLDLNRLKDWQLTDPDPAHRPELIFAGGKPEDPAALERRLFTSPFTCTLPVTGTRQMAGHGPIPGRRIINFSPVPSRQVLGSWVDAFDRTHGVMTERQRRRLTGMLLLLAHVHSADEFMPVVGMLSGHPNFLADVKAVPPAMARLFPKHSRAGLWADQWEKTVELNTRFNTRPAVRAWDAHGGRWTENLGTYVWAFLGPSLKTSFLLKQYDGRERFLSPQLAEMAEWLVNALSAPFLGESESGWRTLQETDYGREWGVVAPGKGPYRVHPPQGAHSEQRMAPRELWYFGQCLQRYAPLAAEYAMWAARPTHVEMEAGPDHHEPWDVMYQGPDNRGTNPRLRSRKFTGYGVVLRAGVDAPAEVSVHLQQIDDGPNYRWGRAGEGGCGILYFYAAGTSYSYTAPEDVGDRDDQDTDFCTTFGVYKNGGFRSIGMNVLSRPLYDLGTGQFAEIVPRLGPGSYASPEHVGRSVLLAGTEYFVLYDAVAHQALTHRLSWFVRRGDPLPAIHLLLGASGHRETQKTELTTSSSSGVWLDGLGDSLAVVTHRKDLQSEATPFGGRLRLPGVEDLVFRRQDPVEFDEYGCSFRGTAGWIRTTATQVEMALFHGTRIEVPGLLVETQDTDLGFSARVSASAPLAGRYLATRPATVRISGSRVTGPLVFHVDGAPVAMPRDGGQHVVELPAGSHAWELTESLPVPIAPRILRTENRAGGARVIVGPVAGASGYRLELSRDGGLQWQPLPTHSEAILQLTGLQSGEKVHLRAVAVNAHHESPPGTDYPLYATDDPPAAPDGLRVDLADGAALVHWGEVLGVTEYRLYGRARSGGVFQLLYQGLERSYPDHRPGLRACDPIPGKPVRTNDAGVFEYVVTAVNGNGESPRSHPADTDPSSWRNWDPRPGEPFRRVTRFPLDAPEPDPAFERQYPD